MKRYKGAMLKLIFFHLSLIFCLNLSQAQTNPSSSTERSSAPTSPTAIPSAVTTAPGSSSAPTQPGAAPATSPTGDTLGPVKAAPGKYEEYQSICRTNDYENVFHLTDEVKNKRIKLLQEKISSNKDANRMRLRLLKEYIDQHKKTEITDTYAEIKKQKLTSDENNLADGYLAFSQKKFKVAQGYFEKIVAAEPKNIEFIKFLAEIYKEQKNFYEAEQIYEDLNKQYSGGYYDLLCEVLILDSHHADGEKACKKAVLEKPASPYPHIFLGVSSREKENLKDAYDYFKNSLKIKETEMGLTCLGELYFIDNKFDKAIENFTKSTASAPGSTRALVGLAWAQLKNKNVDESLQTFSKICKIDRALIVELRKAYKFLTAQSSPAAKKFADQIQICNQ